MSDELKFTSFFFHPGEKKKTLSTVDINAGYE
jgi:hypothetical protein